MTFKHIAIFIFLTVLYVAKCCNPGEESFAIIIIYKDASSSQSLSILDDQTGELKYSFNGYGHDNTLFKQEICLFPRLYRVIAKDGLRGGWSEGSMFIIKAYNLFHVLEGTCDIGGSTAYTLLACVPIRYHDNWLFQDNESIDERWNQPDFDDSAWDMKRYDSFPPYSGNRYYRIKTFIPVSTLNYTSAAVLAINHRNITSVFVNGIPVYLDLEVASSVEDLRFDHYLQYSVPIHYLDGERNNTHAEVTVAITSRNQGEDNPIADHFDAIVFLITQNTNRIMDSRHESSHWKDYYSNPMDYAMDGNKKTFWRISGTECDASILFNDNRYEFINQYSIVTAPSNQFCPFSWSLQGCILSSLTAEWNCTLLDEQDHVKYDAGGETRVFALRNNDRSYQKYTFLIHNDRTVDEIWIAAISLSTSALSTLTTLVYPSSSFDFILYISDIRISPSSSGYTSFRITPELPFFISIDSRSGTLYGHAEFELNSVFTITAESTTTGIRESVSIRIVISKCDDERVLLAVRSTSYEYSSCEYWRLVGRNNETIDEGHGSDTADVGGSFLKYYCLAPDFYTLYQRAESIEGVHGGSITIMEVDRDAFSVEQETMHVLFQQGYTNCKLEWNWNDQDEYSNCKPLVINLNTLIYVNDTWRVSSDLYVDREWNQPDYDDSYRWFSSSMATLPNVPLYRFRKVFSIEDLGIIQSMDVRVKSDRYCELYINGVSLAYKYLQTFDKWSVFHIPRDILVEGKNCLAFRFSVYNQESTRSINRDSFLLPLRVFARFVYSSTSSLSLDNAEVSASSSKIGYGPEHAFDYNTESDWIGDCYDNKVTLSASFSSLYNTYISYYCITASSKGVMEAPQEWRIRGKGENGRWYDMDSIDDILYTRNNEKRCFPIVNKVSNYVWIGFSIEFVCMPHQNAIRLSQMEIHPSYMKSRDAPSSVYQQTHFDIINLVPIPELRLASPYFSHFHCLTPLPSGLFFDEGNGQIYGFIVEDIDMDIHIQANSNKNKVTYATLTFHTKKCTDDHALLAVALDKINDVNNYLSFTLKSSDSSIVDTQSIIPQDAVIYYYCLAKNVYYLHFVDISNAGFLAATYSVTSDDTVLDQGFFNPGYTSLSISLHVGTLLPASTQWYYSVENVQPKSQWYASIDPVHETWEVASPGSFPNPSGITKYFKTVLIIENRMDLEEFSSFDLMIHLKGGCIVYLNGKEVWRRYLSMNTTVTKDTLPFMSSPTTTPIHAALSIQFSPLTVGTNVLAIEVHDMEVEKRTEFSLALRLIPNYSQRHIFGDLTCNKPESSIESLEAIMDMKYYNKFVSMEDCEDVEIQIDTKDDVYEYVTEMCMYTGNDIATYPHQLKLYGGKRSEMRNSLRGSASVTIDWTLVYEKDSIFIDKNNYGSYKCYHFYNENSYSVFKLQFDDCGERNMMEIAEIEFFTDRIDGYCQDNSTVLLTNTPSGEWKVLPCPDLYAGKIMRFCSNGEWTETVNYCIPKAPQNFKYPSTVYVSRGKWITITPSILGAELFFTSSSLPRGLSISKVNGEIFGSILDFAPGYNVMVTAQNVGGKTSASFSIFMVNNHEDALFILACILVLVFLLFIVILTCIIGKNSDTMEQTAKENHLNTDRVPKNMIPLLL